jgi:hypothetical protein
MGYGNPFFKEISSGGETIKKTAAEKIRDR